MNYCLNFGSRNFPSLGAIRAGLFRFLLRFACVLAYSGLFEGAGPTQSKLTTEHNDTARTGANTHETVRTLGNVNATPFRQLSFSPVKDGLHALPIYIHGETMGSGRAQVDTPDAGPAWPIKASANGRYLVDQNNVPWPMLASSPQPMIAKLPLTGPYSMATRRAWWAAVPTRSAFRQQRPRHLVPEGGHTVLRRA